MKTYFLDTSFLIDLAIAREEALDLHEDIKGKEVTGTVCLYELMKFTEKIDPLLRKELVPLEGDDAAEASRIYRRLKSEGKLIADLDILIAGMTSNRGYTLVTRDRDFENIGELDLLFYE